jgi:nitrate reductase NapE component
MAEVVAMNTRKFISALICTLCCWPLAAVAESGAYRVEVLVFSHVDSSAQPLELQDLRAFTAFPELGERLEPEAPVKLDVMSSAMDDIWRRLRQSASFRPLLFAAWEQSRVDYHPPLHLHDEEVIAEHLYFPYQVAFLDLMSTDVFGGYLAPYYRLDGTVQLVRSRFLHLNIDLEYRQELLPRPQPVPESREAALQAQDEAMAVLESTPGPALVHALRQSRQVRIGEMQYFDSPYLGVLARVTATAGE